MSLSDIAHAGAYMDRPESCNPQFERMLTARQVADFLHVSISTVRRWSDRGMLHYYRIGSRGDRRYKREDVMRFLRESEHPSP